MDKYKAGWSVRKIYNDGEIHVFYEQDSNHDGLFSIAIKEREVYIYPGGGTIGKLFPIPDTIRTPEEARAWAITLLRIPPP